MKLKEASSYTINQEEKKEKTKQNTRTFMITILQKKRELERAEALIQLK